jgi:hypothetical protein
MSHSPEKLRELERSLGQETRQEVHAMPKGFGKGRAHVAKRSCWCNPELNKQAWEEGGIKWVHRLENEA